MHMGNQIMTEPSSDPDLLGFNPAAKILVKLAEGVSEDTVTGGKEPQMRMEDTRLIARGEVQYTGMMVEWETRERAGRPEWRSLIADELVELKGSMRLIWGETEEGTALLNPELMFRTRRHGVKGATQVMGCQGTRGNEWVASAIASPLLGGHTLLPTASVEPTTEWRIEWETWVGGLLWALQDAKEEGDHLEIPHDVVQAIAMAEVAYTNLESQTEIERMRELRSDRGRAGMHAQVRVNMCTIGVEPGSLGESGRDRQGMSRLLDLVNFWKMPPRVKGPWKQKRALINPGAFQEEDLRAQSLTTPDEGMYEDQEIWCPEWQRKLLTRAWAWACQPNDNKSFVEVHDTWKRWVAEAGARKQEVAQQEAAEREAAERERERMEEKEVARVREMVEQMATDESLGEEQEGGKGEEQGLAMVTSPATTPSKKGKGRDPRLAVVIPACKRPSTRATRGVRSSRLTMWKGRGWMQQPPERSPGGSPRGSWVTTFVEEQTDARRVRRGTTRCQSKRVACSMSIKAQREHEVSVTSGVSKSKTRAKGKGKARQVQPEQAMSGPSRAPGSSRPWVHPGTISSAAAEVMGADLLNTNGQSTSPITPSTASSATLAATPPRGRSSRPKHHLLKLGSWT
ncbi:hypothetical protein BDN67DRAFT_984840 [Paxillus ammoniavirescens]|nr:hypothetical protein BDN67DRAFT_984840 [Paxillus ammoniavirescens]